MKTLFIEITDRNTIENYWFAYFKTTEILYRSLIKECKNWYGDTSVIVPYLYCVRHTLELAIKILLIRKNKRYQTYNFKSNNGSGHNLTNLWKELDLNPKEMPNFESLVKSLSFDDDGKYFSYPIKKNLEKSLKNTKINDMVSFQKMFRATGNEFITYLGKKYPEYSREMFDKARPEDLDRMVIQQEKLLKRKTLY